MDRSDVRFMTDEDIVFKGFLFQVAIFVLSAWATPFLWNDYHRKEMTTSLRFQARAQIPSLFHSIIASVAAMYMLYTIRDDDDPLDERGSRTIDSFALNFSAGTLVGHLIADTVYSIVFRSKMSEYKMFWEMLLHHALFLLAVYMNFQDSKFVYTFPILYIGEFSSIFLAFRWMLLKAGKTDSARFALLSVLFALSFIACRVGMLGAMVVELLHYLFSHPDVVEGMVVAQKICFFLLLPSTLILNLYWSVGIVKSSARAIRGAFGSSKKTK